MPHENEGENLGSSSSWVSFEYPATPAGATTPTENTTHDGGFVGSPEDRQSVRPSSTKILASGPEAGEAFTRNHRRPSLGRSASTTRAQDLRRRHGTFYHKTSGGSRTPQPEWSVFGQLMENEGQLKSPISLKRKRSKRDDRSGSGEATPGSLTNSYFGGNIQSPVVQENIQANPFGDGTDRMESDSETSDSDSDTDTESTHSTSSLPRVQEPEEPKWYSPRRLTQIPVLYRNILKCSIAYFIASLFTYSPYLSGFMSDLIPYGTGGGKPLPSGHMVATVAVYFNPAKTMGGMLEADIFCIFGLFYAAFVALASMSMFWWIDVQPGWEWLADLIAITWIGVSMSFLAWMKLWMANPQFGTACSMISIIIFVVVVKEGGLHTLLQVTFIVLCGTVVSNLVCYFIWPTTATSNLQSNMTKTLDSFSTLLSMLTDTFLLEESHKKSQGKLQRAVEAHQSSFTSLKKNLKEAKTEWFFWGRFRQHSPIEERLEAGQNGPEPYWGASGIKRENDREKAYEDAIDCLNRLGQHLNGLRSGTRLQYELTQAGVVEKKVKHRKGQSKRANEQGPLIDVSIPDVMEESVAEEDEETVMLKAAAAMFGDLVDDLGPPLKALSSICTTSFKRLRESFVQSQMQIHYHHHHRRRKNTRSAAVFHPSEFSELVSEIDKQLMRFESTSNHALIRLYRKSDVSRVFQSQSSTSQYQMARSASAGASPILPSQEPRTISLDAYTPDVKENTFLTSQDNEHVFLVYFFIFTLQEFATELTLLVDAMERIYTIEQQRLTWRRWWGRVCNICVGSVRSMRNMLKKPAYLIPEKRRNRPSFPKVRPHAPNTLQTPSRKDMSFMGRLKQRLWSLSKRLGQRDAKYAIKTGMATAILAAPAFFDRTRPIFVSYYGDWALISYFVVMSPTIGATNFMGLHRILGTVFSAAIAAGVYSLFPENAPVLAVFGFFYSIPCFYVLVGKPNYAASARFVLLTYNLTCLYCYNLRVKDLSVVDIAKHRALAVTVGVVWAGIVSRFWWPTEARRELSRALGEFCLNMGWLYTRLVASNSFSPEYKSDEEDDHGHSSSLMLPQRTRLNNSIQEFMAMELHLQIKLIELQGLLAQTQHEPRLKGPFPVALYRGILTSLQTILDRLHSMRCVTTREEWYTSVRKDFILPVNHERRELVGNIILFFSVLASAFQLKAPLPPYLPPAEESRQRLVDAIRRLEVVRNRDIKGSRQLLFFAYALTMKGVTQELKTLGHTLQDAFGVIGQTPEEFEALFVREGAAVDNMT
ncbi:hypothetical protein Moror_15634 [Moniliophthora roreri MCA 2997]|uniref:Uncharacterized protein n=1 Tax=Moniliophthora roreri (strain MCA 2997) TaxID=1381753 RepID=V2W9A4_MONRO|nr:hypothetical protein Moror_15634 [Moniliophthora roreri MCA 2997]